MKISFFKTLFIIVFSTIFILGLVYLGLGYYYRDSFSYGTNINGIYCTGRTPVEVNRLLNEQYVYNGLTITTENNDTEITIKPSDIDFKYDFKQSLSFYLEAQNSWLWPLNLTTYKNRTLNPIVSFNTDKLDGILDRYELFTYDKAADVSFECIDGVYVLKDTMLHRPDSAALREAVYNCIYDSKESFVIDQSYFEDMVYSKDQIETIEEYSAIKSMMGARITYIMGDSKEYIDEAVLNGFLLRDENGDLVPADITYVDDEEVPLSENPDIEDVLNSDENAENIKNVHYEDAYRWDEQAISDWVDALAEKYDTVGATRTFSTTYGSVIEVTGGIYGNMIDREAEVAYLSQAVEERRIEEHEPEYSQKAFCQGLNDIGDTYIEVNMTDQHLFYYENGEVKIDTPVVTGNMNRHMNTPSGTNYVYFKQRNRTLRGDNYATFVNYWMAVNGHYGIHDATWRNKFGGDEYLANGSHGCINTPMEAVSRLYDMVEVGTPVVMYYTDTENSDKKTD